MGKKVNDTIGTTLKICKGYTTCANCNRSMQEIDVDSEGYCPEEACQQVRTTRKSGDVK